MRKFGLRHTCAFGALAVSTLVAAPAMAQDADAGDDASAQEGNTIVVTGSFIRGTPEDAAQPVDTFSAAELEVAGFTVERRSRNIARFGEG